MKRRNLLASMLALSGVSFFSIAVTRNFQPIATWTPSDDYEFDEDGCVIGFWYHPETMNYSLPKVLPGNNPLPMHSMENPGVGWHHFTMTQFEAYEDGKLIIKRLTYEQQKGIELIVMVAQKQIPHYFFIRRKVR